MITKDGNATQQPVGEKDKHKRTQHEGTERAVFQKNSGNSDAV